MAAGFGLLRLSPDAFWSMTPREFHAALRGLGCGPENGPLAHGDLLALMARFPDQKRTS